MPGSIDIKFEIDGEAVLDRRLLISESRMKDWRPLMRDQILPELRTFEQAVFDSGGSMDSMEAWAPLSPSTIKRKGHGRPLIDTTALMRSFQGGSGGISVISRAEMVFGTAVRYAIFHQRGTRRMARRPVLRISTRMQGQITALLARWLRG